MNQKDFNDIYLGNFIQFTTHYITVADVCKIHDEDSINAWLKSSTMRQTMLILEKRDSELICVLHNYNVNIIITTPTHSAIHINQIPVDEWIKVKFIDFCLDHVKLKYKNNSILLNKFVRYYNSLL